MIGYLIGTIARVYYQQLRGFVDLEVRGVGYEVQVLSRWAQTLETSLDTEHRLFTHLQIREDQWLLFGFATAAERDLFRELISVSGIGTQTAMSLMDGLDLPTLVEAIATGNSRLLSTAPGVGKKTAERLTLELKTRLKGWCSAVGVMAEPSVFPIATIQEEVELTLQTLGYSDQEIFQALAAVGRDTKRSKTSDVDDWIRDTLAWLSQNSA